MDTKLERRYTLEEYFELEEPSEERFEFFDGEVFCLSGASQYHSEISGNCIVQLITILGRDKCRVFTCRMHIKVHSGPPYLYADVSALCGKSKFEKVGGMDALTNPQLVIEVLSPSTHAYGRADRCAHFKSIPTLREYLLVAQHRPHVTHLYKDDEGKWIHEEMNDLDSSVRLHSPGCELPMGEIYSGVNFDSPATT